MFRDNMNKALRHVPGALGCLLIGFDGIPIASVYTRGQEEIEPQVTALAVETAQMLRKMHRMAAAGETPYVGELTMTTDTMSTLSSVIQGEYLLVVALSPETDMNRAKLMLRLMRPWIEEEM